MFELLGINNCPLSTPNINLSDTFDMVVINYKLNFG